VYIFTGVSEETAVSMFRIEEKMEGESSFETSANT
jgi:hypothetical protein